MNNSYATLLAEVGKNCKAILSSDEPEAAKLAQDALRLLSKVLREERRVAIAAKKLTGKGSKHGS